jgi:hypothetical protein
MRSLCIKSGTRELLRERFPQLAGARAYSHYRTQAVTFLPPPPDQWPAQPVSIDRIVFPQYVAGAETRLVPLSRAEAMELLLAQSLNQRLHGAEGIAATARLLRQAGCYRLTVGDLDAALELLMRES